MSAEPSVSLVIPAYQASDHLPATLASALAQTGSELEILVVDNASTDATPDILAGVRDPRVRVIRNSSTLPIDENWNIAVCSSHGDLVKVLCADDLIAPDAVARQAAVLATDPTVAVVSSRIDMIDDAGHVIRAARGLRGLTGPRSAREVIRAVVRSGGNPLGPPASVMFRRRDFDAIGGFDAAFGFPMELELWTRLLRRGSFVGLPETLASFRVSSTSITSGLSIRTQLTEHRRVIDGLVADPRWRVRRSDVARGQLGAQTMQARRTLLQLRARASAGQV